MTKEERNIKKAFDGKRNLLLVGPGGTGKSTLLREYIETHPETIVCAPTGTAAVNIGGVTIHKAFSVPVPAYGANVRDVPENTVKILAAADTVIIDEISMCRNDVFSFMIRVLRKAERKKGSRIRVIASGDFYQLPPVVQKKELKFFKKFDLDPSGFPFTTKEWSDLNFKVVELNEIKRQSDNDFIEQLNKARRGDSSCIPWFNEFVVTEDTPVNENTIHICGTNAEADRINNDRFNDLYGMPIAFQAITKGRIGESFVDKIVMFKKGERVIFTVNDVIRNQYQNGTLGTVKEIYENRVLVEIDGQKNPVFVYPHTWTLHSYKVKNGFLEKNEIGSISQIPLRPAYALTIHKSQGKTFDEAVITPRTFAPGQLYVALSRVRTPSGLFLTEPIFPEYLLTSDVVNKFIDNGYTWDAPVKPAKTRKAEPKTTSKTKSKGTAKTTSKKKSKTTPKGKTTSKAKPKTTSKADKNARTAKKSAGIKKKTTANSKTTASKRNKKTATKPKKGK